MGYRHHLYIIPRATVDTVRNMSYEELKTYAKERGKLEEYDGEEPYISFINLFDHNEFFCFGKYYENADAIYKLGVPLFEKTDTQAYFEDYAPFVVGKEAVVCAIEHYQQKVIAYYESLLMTQEQFDATHTEWERRGGQEKRIRTHLENQLSEWKNPYGLSPYNLAENSSSIVNAWLYEYEVFELAHQLKMMDWETNTLLFYGW